MNSRSRWYERNEIKRITKDWVDINVRITDRELELLKIIYERKLVRRDMLEIISPSYRNLGDNRTRIINRSINKLFKNMCIDKIHEPQKFMKGNTPAIISLDRAGSIVLGVQHKRRIIHEKNIVNGVEYINRIIPSSYKHINGVNQLEVDTINFCEYTNSIFTDWTIEKPVHFYYSQNKILLIPDVLLSLRFSTNLDKDIYAYIEFDTGSENIRYKNPPIIREKVINYKKYKLSNIWSDEYPYFPMLLLVTKDYKRIDFFNKLCKENSLIGFGVYYKNYKKFLEHLSSVV